MYRLSRPLGNVLLKWARLARLPANQAEEATIASAPFSAEFGTLVVIHDPRAARRGGRDPWRQSSAPQQEEPSCRF